MGEERTYTKEELDAEVSGLKAKNDDLITVQKQMKKTMQAFDGIDLDALQEHSKELEILKESQLSDEDRRAKVDKETSVTMKRLNDEITTKNRRIVAMKKETAISSAILAAGAINEGMSEAVEGLLSAQAQVSDEGVVVIGKDPVADYVADWSKNDGKMFFVPKNTGGGGQGGSGGSGGGDEKYFDRAGDDYNLTKQAELAKKNPAKYKEYSERYKKKG